MATDVCLFEVARVTALVCQADFIYTSSASDGVRIRRNVLPVRVQCKPSTTKMKEEEEDAKKFTRNSTRSAIYTKAISL